MQVPDGKAAIIDPEGMLVHSPPDRKGATRRPLTRSGGQVPPKARNAAVGHDIRGFAREGPGDPGCAQLANQIGTRADTLLPQLRLTRPTFRRKLLELGEG